MEVSSQPSCAVLNHIISGRIMSRLSKDQDTIDTELAMQATQASAFERLDRLFAHLPLDLCSASTHWQVRMISSDKACETVADCHFYSARSSEQPDWCSTHSLTSALSSCP